MEALLYTSLTELTMLIRFPCLLHDCLEACWFLYLSSPTSVDNMEAALLPGERNDMVSTNKLGHGWAIDIMAEPKRCAELND